MSSDSNGDSSINHLDETSEVASVNKFKIKKKAIYTAFAANIGIAVVKFACFVVTRSSAMLSESIHSAVDSINSICLLVGINRASKQADEMHPFGYGLEANIWALFASILMFLGAIVSFYGGYEKITNADFNQTKILLDNYVWVAITLCVSGVFEFLAMINAAKAILAEMQVEVRGFLRKYIESIKYINQTKSQTTRFVWFEDSTAFFGVLIALVALSISKFVLPAEFAHYPDGIASVFIGLLLLGLSLVLLSNNVNFLTGKAAAPKVEKIIKDVADNIHGISCVHELKTMDMGSSGLIVNMNIEVDPDTPVKEADDIADRLEDAIRHNVDNISHVNIEIQADDAEEHWEEKFEKLIEEGKEIDAIDSKEGQILSNFSDFANTVVKEVMIPRPNVNAIDVADSLDELCEMIITTGHTRIPVYDDNIDNIIGVVNAKDVLRATRSADTENFSIRELVREVLFIPENKFISELLSDLNSAKSQLAIVVDEHGGVAGIVTVEDILEELVGEIYDEFDAEEVPELLKIDDCSMDICSKMDIADLNERFGLDIPTDDFQTIGGYVFGLLGREPEIGDVVADKDISYTVLEVDGRRISRLNMKRDVPFVEIQEESSQQKDVEHNV